MKKILSTSFLTTFLLLCGALSAGAQSYFINLLAGNGIYASSGDGGQAQLAGFESPSGVATDAAGNIYIADQNANRVRKVDATTGIITTIAGNNNVGLLGDGGPATSASLNGPTGVTFDAVGNLYITDGSNHCIRKVNTSGIISTVAGNGSQGFSGDGFAATSAELRYPTGVAVDVSGNLFIADANNYRIRKVDAVTGIITTVAGSGSMGFSGDGFAATSAAFNLPWNVRVDASGNLYIADRDNNRIRKVDATTGSVTTIAGNGTSGFSGDGGAATSAQFDEPSDLAFDAAGNLYITDSYNRRIRKIDVSGNISTVAGNGTFGFSGDGGPALTAEMKFPAGITVDAKGTIYFADVQENRVRVLQMNGLNFDGIDDHVDINATVGNFGTGDFTAEAWFKTTPNGGGGPLISKRGICNHAYFWNLLIANGKVVLEVDDDNNNYFSVTTPLTYNDGQWHHVASTRVGTTLTLYIDGIQVVTGSSTGAAANINSSANLQLGASACGYFEGTIDEVRLWDRALCLTEINNNRNGSLPQPLAQSGLVAYYTFEEGLPAGTNTGTTNLIDRSGKGNNGTLTNFALTGSTSNYVKGATAGNTASYNPAPVAATQSATRAISSLLPMAVNNCDALLSITPAGSSPVSGNVDFKVTIDGSVQTTTGGKPYVQRHFDVEPANNAATATANLTLYFTQAEFTAFNAVRGALPALPVDAADAADYKANLRITQFHGVPTGGNAPANYPSGSGNQVLITPALVAYNTNASRWEVTFPVTGFSGFFVSTNQSLPLPVSLLAFTAKAQGSANLLHWNTATEGEGVSFEVTRSADGSNFEKLGSVAGKNSNSAYAFYDEAPLAGVNYYRLNILESSGEKTQSTVALVRRGNNLAGGISVWPVPAGNTVTISTTNATLMGSIVVALDMQGRVMAKAPVSPSMQLDIQTWPAGIYTLKFEDGTVVKVVKH